jgi:hypothetical protein
MLVSGTVRATLLDAQRYEIHGQPGWRIVWRTADGAPSEAMLPVSQVAGAPRPGAAADVTVVLGNAVEIRVIP